MADCTRGDPTGPAYVYCHVDPIRWELLYVGCAMLRHRLTQTETRHDRSAAHAERLAKLLNAGVPLEQVCHIIADNLPIDYAVALERGLIETLLPPMNKLLHPARRSGERLPDERVLAPRRATFLMGGEEGASRCRSRQREGSVGQRGRAAG